MMKSKALIACSVLVAGAKYITITARHCDGFALWPSKVDGYNIAATPFKRDVIGELVEKAVLVRKGYAR
jgi:alpha-L-fucosidase